MEKLSSHDYENIVGNITTDHNTFWSALKDYVQISLIVSYEAVESNL